jgi:hypothetical protein
MSTSEWLQEYASSRGLALRVDRAQSLIRGVKILGLESRNGRSYVPEALEQAAALYEGAKVNVNHPRTSAAAPRDYQDRLGSIREVRFRPGEGLFADLAFNPKHALAEQLVWDAEHAPENVGISHNVEARTARREGRTVVEAILKVQSVDLVADPATTSGLFEAAESRDAATSATSEARGLPPRSKSHPPAPLANEEASSVPLDEVARLERTVEELQGAARRRQRLDEAARLLRQVGLPAFDDSSPAARTLLDEEFRERLAGAASASAVREMIDGRVRLVETAAAWHAARLRSRRPTAREQRLVEEPLLEATSARQFVDCISRRR